MDDMVIDEIIFMLILFLHPWNFKMGSGTPEGIKGAAGLSNFAKLKKKKHNQANPGWHAFLKSLDVGS